MLLQFRVKNYKSFVDETIFSMEAAPKQKGLDYSLTSFRHGKQTTKVLCSSVIYGPNASGKTNIIGAMDTFRRILLRGNIRDTQDMDLANPAADKLELIPNNALDANTPVEFGIKFLENNWIINYDITLNLGNFLDDPHVDRKILAEKLTINGAEIFTRDNTVKMGDYKAIKKYLTISEGVDAKGMEPIANASLNDEELFLTNGFKVLYSQNTVGIIMNWITDKFVVQCRTDALQTTRRIADMQKPTVYVDKTVEEAAEIFGINSNAIGYEASSDDSQTKLCSILHDKEGQTMRTIPAEIFESYGTIRFVNIFPIILKCIKTGGTLVMDEFDASIHPMALMNIIGIFHNDDINVNHAQLIFNTHNPIFLNSNIFRRDEIKFVDRDDETHHSELYALSDFGTSGDNAVRKHDDYMKHYFVNEYGAVRDIDFSPIFEKLMSERGNADA